jgi:2-polyprenyl-6-methoxyphenol hydroxylase-like FAD-dependent oxidoreductase
MSGHPKRVLVVGGGIAGLATARAMLGHGIECDVVERTAEWVHPGAAMYLPANSVRALGTLGLQSALLDGGYEITRQQFLDHRGRLLLDVDLPAVWGATGPCAAISRRSLHELMPEAIPVRLGTTVTALHADGPLVRAVFDDGSTGDYDLVVGADGVRSWVRSSVLGGAAPRFVGQASWRFLVDGFPEISAWMVRLGRGKAFLTIPLGGGRIYCYADVNVPGPIGGDPAKPGRPLRRLRRAGTHDPARTPAGGRSAVLRSDRGGRPGALGARPCGARRDAAHATSPNMAEGAGMALEDAIVLARTVATERPLAEFESRRRPRVAFVQSQTHRRDRTRNLPAVVRNTTLRLAGQRIFRANYAPLLSEP